MKTLVLVGGAYLAGWRWPMSVASILAQAGYFGAEMLVVAARRGLLLVGESYRSDRRDPRIAAPSLAWLRGPIHSQAG